MNGSVTLSKVDGTSVTATSVNGDLDYDGPIRNGGRYTFSTHNGDITLSVAEATNASVSVSTFNGEFESSFPVTLTETRKGKRFSFRVGHRQRPGDAGVFPGDDTTRAPRSCPERTR